MKNLYSILNTRMPDNITIKMYLDDLFHIEVAKDWGVNTEYWDRSMIDKEGIVEDFHEIFIKTIINSYLKKDN